MGQGWSLPVRLHGAGRVRGWPQGSMASRPQDRGTEEALSVSSRVATPPAFQTELVPRVAELVTGRAAVQNPAGLNPKVCVLSA